MPSFPFKILYFCLGFCIIKVLFLLKGMPVHDSSWNLIRERISGYFDDVVRLQEALIPLPALAPESGGEGEWLKAETVRRFIEAIGVDEWIDIPAPDERVPKGYRPNMTFRWRGRSPDRTVWILSHLDVVPPGDRTQWENDPFRAVFRDGKVIGRGAEDNHQALVSSILAVRAFRETKTAVENGVGLIIVSDEETGSRYGIHHVLNVRPDLFRKTDWIVVPDAGDPDGTLIETAEKSVLWLRFVVKGKQTHGSTPEKGINAHRAGAHLIVKLDGLSRIFSRNDPLFDPPPSTFEPTKKEANVPNVNTVPGEDAFHFDCRVLPDVPLDAVRSQIRDWSNEIEASFGVRVQIEETQATQAPPATPSHSPVVLALKAAVREVLNRDAQTKGIGGGTVAEAFRARGLPAVCWTCIDDTAHTPNEYSKVENTLNDAKVFAHLFMQK